MEILNLIIKHSKELVGHIVYTGISLKIIFWLTNLLKIAISKYRNTKDYSNLKVEINYAGNYIKLDVINFDGYNYIFKLGVDAFKAVDGEGVIMSASKYESHIIHMSREEISVIDILKITTLKKLTLSKKTSSNIIRVLTNTGVIR